MTTRHITHASFTRGRRDKAAREHLFNGIAVLLDQLGAYLIREGAN